MVAITIILYARKVPGSIFIGMIITAFVGMITGQIHTPSGIVGKIQSITPTFGATLKHLKIQAIIYYPISYYF